MPFCDSHAHLTSPEVLPIVHDVIQRAHQLSVDKIVNICTDQASLHEGLLLAKKELGIVNIGATTPHDVEKEGDLCFPLFEEAARGGLLRGIGETGLDYYYEELDKKVQQKFLVKYLYLAAELELPVVFHCRNAFKDLFSIVDAEYPKKGLAVLHCFTGTMKEAEEVLKRGWHVSLSGIVTFKKSESLRDLASIVPLEQLLIETDTPYLAPQSKRGKQNEPSFIIETAECIAKIKGVSLEEVAKRTYQNAERLFCSC